jgi:hypothetical protein
MGEVVDLRQMTVGNKINKLFELRAKKGEVQVVLNDLNKEIETLEYAIIQDMENSGLERLSTDSGTVSRTVKLYPKIEDMDAFVKWCADNDRTDMIQKRVNEGSFREYFEQYNMYPEGLDAYEKSSLNVRRSR